MSYDTNNHESRALSESSGSWPMYFKDAVDEQMYYATHSPYMSKKGSRKKMKEASPLILNEMEQVCSSTQATFNTINVLLGVGVLSLPYAFKCAGIVPGLCLLTVFSCMTNYTGKLLGKCIEYNPLVMRSYPDIGEAAFGSAGRVFISIAFFLELLTACVMFLILVGDNLNSIIKVDGSSATTLTIIAFIAILPSTWTKHLGLLSYFSILGILSSIYLLAVLLYAGFSTDGGHSYIYPDESSIEFGIPSDSTTTFLMSIGLVMVGFSGHAVFPSIYSSMGTTERLVTFPKMLNQAYVIVYTVYGAIGICGYLMYGQETQKEVSLNLVKDSSLHGVVITSMILMVALNPAMKFAITMNPIAMTLEEAFLKNNDSKMHHIVLRTLIGSVILVIAITVPDFARVTGILGSLCAMIVSAIFPCVCCLKLYPNMQFREKVLNYVIIVFSTVMALSGTYAAFFSNI